MKILFLSLLVVLCVIMAVWTYQTQYYYLFGLNMLCAGYNFFGVLHAALSD